MLAAEFRVAVSPVIASPVLRRLLPAFAVSAVGDGMSAVGVAWLAIRIAPPADRDLVVGVAVAAYTLPGAAGAVLLARPLRALAGRHLVAGAPRSPRWSCSGCPSPPWPASPAACSMRPIPPCRPPCSSGKAPRNCSLRSWPPAAR